MFWKKKKQSNKIKTPEKRLWRIPHRMLLPAYSSYLQGPVKVIFLEIFQNSGSVVIVNTTSNVSALLLEKFPLIIHAEFF